TLSINVGDINEAPTVTTTLAAERAAEDAANGTTVATSSASDPESSTISYSLSGTGSDNFSVDANGNVTVASSLDYETTTSYTITLTASDGTNSTQETITINVSDVDEFTLALSSTSPSINEGVSSGTQVATSTLTQQDSASVTYSLSGTGSDKFAISSSGVITTAAAMDYETASSYSLTVTVTDGTNTDTETINISINDLTINTLATTLANSGAALAESSSSGTAVASSSINNPDSDTITYTLSGTGSSNFSVDSSGNVTTNGSLDFETAKSYALTLTATAGSTSVTDTFTVNVGNVAELNAAVLRYSAAYNSVSRTGFSATATRGASGSSLPAYYLEQVGTSPTTNFNDVFDHDGDVRNNPSPTVRVEIGGGTQLNFEYIFPITSQFEAATGVYAPSIYGSAGVMNTTVLSNGAAYRGILTNQILTSAEVIGTTGNSPTITTNEIVSAGAFMQYSGSGNGVNASTGGDFAFMTTNKAGASLSYQSSTGQRTYGVVAGSTQYYQGNYLSTNNSKSWRTAMVNAGYTFLDCTGTNVATCISNAGTDLDDVGIIATNSLGTVNFGYNYDQLADYIEDGGNMFMMLGEHPGWGNARLENDVQAQYLLDALGWSGFALDRTQSNFNLNTTISSSTTSAITNAGGTLDYSGVAGKTYDPAASGYFSVPSVCNSLVNQILMVCDPGRTGATGTFGGVADTNPFGTTINSGNYDIMKWFAGIDTGGSAVTSTYNLFEDQTTLAGQIYTDAMWDTFVGCNSGSCSSKFAEGILYFAVLPIEYLGTSFNSDSDNWFYPNFMPMTNSNIWTYGDVGLRYCGPGASAGSECAGYEFDEAYEWQSLALNPSSSSSLHTTAREWAVGGNDIPEGSSFFKQMVRYDGVGVGMWAQISFADSYADDSDASNIRDDQQSLLNVVITNMNRRSNMTSMYSAGDTGFGMDGYHYWSYQGATNANDNGLGIVYGTSPVQCATSNETACFWAPDAKDSTATSAPSAMFLTSSDPYASGDMGLGVSYNANTDAFLTGSFNQAVIRQNVKNGNGNWQPNTYTYNYRGVNQNQYSTPPSLSSGTLGWSGYFNGILEFDVSGASNNQFASIGTGSTRASFTFDYGTNFAEVVAPMDITAFASNNYTANWSTVDTGSMTLTFGDLDNTDAKSAFLANNVFAAEIQDNGTQIDGTSGGSNNLAGVMVTWQSLDNPDTTLYEGMSNASENSNAQGGGDAFSDPGGRGHFTKWGFWAMSSADIAVATGDQNASVHLGTWVGGEIIDQSLIPTSGTASKSGGAVFNVAYRHNASGSDYDVHKYTSTADVDATFTWGTSGYSGTLTFKDFDEKNPILMNAGFLDSNGWFTVGIAGTDQHYSGTLTPSLQNGWSGAAAVKGSIFGGEHTRSGTTTTYIESGGNISVNVYKTGDTGTAGANDFYTAEGIYLIY
ncbi:MAG: hypothetical protein CML48_06810, partial [Rhodobacteraceae bacterium]|nr:hypothetical protein [Paracoccaceae bacterium]